MTSVAKWVKGNFPAMKAAFVGTRCSHATQFNSLQHRRKAHNLLFPLANPLQSRNVTLQCNVVFSTGAVSSVIAVAKEPWLGEYVQCIVAENPFTSTSALTDFVVSNVGFKTMLCKGNLLFYSLLYPLCRLVSLATRCKVRLTSVLTQDCCRPMIFSC